MWFHFCEKNCKLWKHRKGGRELVSTEEEKAEKEEEENENEERRRRRRWC